MKQRAIKLYLNNTFEEKSFEVDGVKLYDKGKELNYTPQCIFTEKKPRSTFWRPPRKLMFFVDNCINAVTWDKETDKLQIAWTQPEAKGFVYKQITKALEKFKQMKMWQFVVLIGLQVVIVLLLFRIMSFIGAF